MENRKHERTININTPVAIERQAGLNRPQQTEQTKVETDTGIWKMILRAEEDHIREE